MRVNIAYLRLLTLLFISFSLFPFFLGWMRWYYGLPLSVLLLTGIYLYFRDLDFSIKEYYSRRQLIPFALIIFAWAAFSGSGGMGYQVSDLFKLNTLIKELINNPWPLEYSVGGKRVFLSHYLSYFLAMPTLAGFLGFKACQLLLFFYTYLGVFLGVFWLHRFIKGNMLAFASFLILFGGISTFSFFLSYGDDAIQEFWNKISNHGYVFWLNSRELIPLNYTAVTDMLYWVPQHTLAALLGLGLLLNDGFVDKNIKYTPFALSLLAMWSPLVLVGIFPVFLFVLFYNGFDKIWNVLNVGIAPILFIVQATFLLAIETDDLVKHFIFTDMSGQGVSLLKQVGVYCYFVFFEVLIWAIPSYFVLQKVLAPLEMKFFIFNIVLLCLIPLYRFGLWNDWSNRVSMISILVMALFAFKALLNSKGALKLVLLCLLFFGSHAAVIGIVRSFIYSGYKFSFKSPSEQQVKTLPEVCVGYPITQFVADEDTFFYKYLAKITNQENE